ncbi:g3398 [Coccomyxa elongata]
MPKCEYIVFSLILFVILATGLTQPAQGQSTDANNSVCVKADWKEVAFFGTPVSIAQFKPDVLNVHSSYYRGPVQQRALPTGVLAAMAIVLLLIFLVWRIVRLCCMCCCRWCCVTPSPFPDEVLGSARLIVLKIIITLLSLGVAASCAYGMSKVDPKLVDSGLGVIDSTKAFMNSVFDQAYGVLGDISSMNDLLDQVQTILDVDVDVPSISANITCVALSIGSLYPGPALGYLNSIQNEVDGVLQPSIAALSSNLSTLLGSEIPAFQGYATVVTASPPFLSNYSSETDNFITAVNDLPSSFPTGGSTNSYVLALGSALSALSLPLNGGASSKAGRIGALTTALSSLYGAKPSDLNRVDAISSGISTLSGVGSNLSTTLPALSAILIGAYDNYTAARPCMTSLLTRLQSINSTVVVLPSDINAAYGQLQSAQETLDGVLINGTTSPVLLAADLTTAAAQIDSQPFSNAVVSSLTDSQAQLSNFSDPDGAGGPNTALNGLNSVTISASTDMDNCNAAYQLFSTSGDPTDYTSMQSACNTARSDMSVVQAGFSSFDTSPSSAFGTSVSSLQATATALAALPSNATLQASLSSVSTSVDSVPDVSTFISALTPAVAAYNSLPANLFTDMQNTMTNISTDITQAIEDARTTVNSNVDSFTSKVDDIHNTTVDKITNYEAQYMPTVRQYDKYRQAAEYTYFALAIAVVLGIIFAVLTNCQFATGFFTLVLLILTVVYSIIAIIFFLVASVGNDACTNAEPYIIEKLPSVINDPAMLNNTLAIAEYYLYNQGGGVREILKNVANVDLDDVYATVNSTRDQAVQAIEGAYTLQSKLLAVVDGVSGISDNVTQRLRSTESLASYDTIHPLYIQAKSFLCCSGVNMMGNLWVSMFASGSISIILLIFMLVYIGNLDKLPPRACCGCTMRSKKEFPPLDYKESQRGVSTHVDASAPPLTQQIESSSSLLAPNSPKKVSYPRPTPSYTLRASAAQPSAASHSQTLKQEYMRHALMMDSAGLER